MDEVAEQFSGPKMQALRTHRERVFAWVMACGELSAAEAARKAGCPDGAGRARVFASELMREPRVLDAIEEATRGVLRGLAPLAVRRAREVLDNKDHPAHARMIETVLDRAGFTSKTEHKSVVEHTADAEFAQLAERLARELGTDKVRLIGGNVIEHEPTPDA